MTEASLTGTPTAVKVALAASLVMGAGALVWCFGLNNHLTVAEQKLAAAEQQNTALAARADSANARLRATTETLGQSVSTAQRQLDEKTQSLAAAQAAAARAQAAEAARLQAQQTESAKKLDTVATDVGSVKTDVGGAKASIAETQNDLASTKAQLARTIGDAGVMSGLIARNHDELEQLKHKGDRAYYEFSLRKGAPAVLLANVKLQAKKVDDKHSKYTMIVSADDRNIEKKDKSLDEPVQFYTGKGPVLYEIVVNNIQKNLIEGYLATPKQ